MKPLLCALLASVAFAGCRSTDTVEIEHACICGTPEGAIEQCLHADCVAGKDNPENPSCACGTLSIEEQ